jgi:hypothetical protein
VCILCDVPLNFFDKYGNTLKFGPDETTLNEKNLIRPLADLFLYSYEAESVQKLLQDNNKKLAVSFHHA